MIKLVVPQARQDDYWLTVGVAITDEINGYLKAFDHLKGLNIAKANPFLDLDFIIYRDVVAAVIKKVTKASTRRVTDFNPPYYLKELTIYLSDTRRLADIEFDKLIVFLKFLVDPKATELKDLIMCKPEDLLDKFHTLQKKFLPNSPFEKEIMGSLFNAKTNNRIVSEIKFFFRNPLLTDICPYCNLQAADYIQGEMGDVAEVHELDHFFDKTHHPTLSFSLFNLVPADTFCNKIYNKGGTTVTKQYHLNPYEGGYASAFSFKPIEAGDIIDRFEIIPHVKPGNPVFGQMYGPLGIIKDDENEGNLNLFKIRARYNGELSKKEAAKNLKKIKKHAASRRTVMSFLKRMGRNVSLDAHKRWYYETLPTSFEQTEFGKVARSKLYRDLHDHVFTIDKHRFNKDIRQLIEDNPLNN